jgi:NADH dehydrogenase FAD-containing subunit
MNFIVVGGGPTGVELVGTCRDEKIYSQKIILTKISQN